MVEKAEAVAPVIPEATHKIGQASQPIGSPPGANEKFSSVSNMNELKERAPDLYKAMMQGLAMNICNEMQKHQKRFKEILRKARQNT